MLSRIYGALGLLVLAMTSAQAQSRPASAAPATPIATDPDEALRELRGFDVHVAISAQAADTVGIRNRIEPKLRQNGIRVGSDQAPYLLVSCVALERETEPIVAFTCSVKVHQWVVRAWPSALRILASTWQSEGHVSTVGQTKFRDAIAAKVDAKVDEFLNAWYKANPK